MNWGPRNFTPSSRSFCLLFSSTAALFSFSLRRCSSSLRHRSSICFSYWSLALFCFSRNCCSLAAGGRKTKRGGISSAHHTVCIKTNNAEARGSQKQKKSTVEVQAAVTEMRGSGSSATSWVTLGMLTMPALFWFPPLSHGDSHVCNITVL